MILKNPLPSAQEISARLIYAPDTGEFTWRTKPGFDARTRAWNTKYAGGRAGSVNSVGAVLIRLAGRAWVAHRLAFVLMTGREPADEIDHIDRNPSNNAWSNLREASRAQNNCNRGKPVNNSTGVKGVSQRGPGKFEAHINHQGRKLHCGFWASVEDAGRCIRIVRTLLHGEFATHG